MANRSYRRKMSSISEFFQMFKDSPCLERLTNLDAKGVKRSVKMRATIFYESFSKILCCIWTVCCQKLIHYICTYYVCYALNVLFNVFMSLNTLNFELIHVGTCMYTFLKVMCLDSYIHPCRIYSQDVFAGFKWS